MKLLRYVLFAVAAAAMLAAGVVWMYVEGMRNAGGSHGSRSTPDPTRTRGDLVRVVTHGPFTIEQRAYEAGRNEQSSKFCDYWISFNGKPVTPLEFNYVNHYNSCGAFHLLKADQPTFLIGAYANANGNYLPIVISARAGAPIVELNEACALSSHRDGYAQAWKGWQLEDGKVAFCAKTWAVLPFGG